MALNESLLSLDRSIKELKEISDIDNNVLEQLNRNLSILSKTIDEFLYDWEEKNCQDIDECIDKFFEEGYLQAVDKDNIKQMIASLRESDTEKIKSIFNRYISSVENIFQTIYFEYRFG